MTSTRNKHVIKLLAVFTILYAFTGQGQNYGPEWISYGQKYYKFPVYKESVYRIDSAALSQVFNLATLDPRNLQVFLRGEEQFVYVHGEGDGKINHGDYVELYAHPTTAAVDSLLYHNIRYLPNPFFPLYSDTVYAFITDGGGAPAKRFIQETDTAYSAYPAGQYFYTEKIRSFGFYYNRVDEFDLHSSDPRLTQAEGPGGYKQQGQYEYLAFAGTPVYTAAPLPAYLTVVYSGASSYTLNTPFDHQVQVAYQDNNNSTIVLSDTTFSGFVPVKRRYEISSASLNSSSDFSLISVAAPSFTGFVNITVPHYFHLFYPAPLILGNVQGQLMYTDDHSTATKTAFNFSGLALNGSSSVILYDLSNGRRITGQVSGATVKAVVPDGGGRKKIYMISDSLAVKVTQLQKAGQDGTFTNYLNGSGAKPFVMIYNKKLISSSGAYRDFRSSPAGGSYNVIFADIAQLYDQYSMGIKHHPAAIVNFLRQCFHELPVKPTNVLLLGSATAFFYPASHQLNYIPTMGRPNSDNLLASGLSTQGQYGFYPELPIGRIAAINDQELTVYLDKVKQHEAVGRAYWKKKVLHFVGGDSEFLSASLSTFMSGYEQIIEDTLFGAEVRTFRKNSSEPIQVTLSDSIKEMVNEGAGLLTFFGHGSPYGFDQSIDEPQLYSNEGRYPFLYANSCYSGDIHDPNSATVSKRFVFAPQKGSIGFLATTSLGFVHPLHNYAQQFYRSLSYGKYNRGIGEVIMEAAKNNASSGQPITNFTGLDMTLHGDPAVIISNGMEPDYALANNDVKFALGKHQDSLEVTIVYRNIGMAVHDSVIVLLDRIFPGNDTSSVYSRTKAAFFRDTVRLVIPTEGNKGAGLNYFRVHLDPLNLVPEANENNNSTTGLVEFFIPGNDVVPVYPYNFAVVPRTGSISLKASTIDAYAAQAGYRFELDTSDLFIAPVASTLISSKGGVIEWNVELPLMDSTVYYWRVTRDSTEATHSVSWKESSFQTLGEKSGWAQAHFHQFKNNGYQLVTYKKTLRQFVFENRLNTINARTGFHPYLREPQQTYYFNNNQMDGWSCTFNGWNFAVFDSVTGEPDALLNPAWPGGSSSGTFGNCLCNRGRYHYVYYFGRTNECGNPDLQWKTKVENFLNAIPPNNYVLAYTTGNPSGSAEMSSYTNSLYNAFESIGSGSIRTVPDTVPMVIFGRKGMAPGQAKERVGLNRRDILYTQDSIRTNWNSGYIASEIIGPSYKWRSLHWRLRSLDAGAGDTSVLKVIGIRMDGSSDTLHTMAQYDQDFTGMESLIDAKEYPFLKLVAYMQDNVNRTSPQLKSWHVLFDEAPECAINPTRISAVVKDSLQEGEQQEYFFPIENIGGRNFNDSLAITYWIEDVQRVMQPLAEKKKAAPFVPGQLIVDTIQVDSYRLQGNNALWISVNTPRHPAYQHEQHYFNNVARIPFAVAGDATNPLLDVTFDGRRILNGDIVSAKPTILITVKDENQFLALNDTSAFTVSLQRPGKGSPERIYFSQGLQFTPASLPRNSASILYTPELKVDGKYTLVAQAVDRSNNRSGAKDYKIQFEVKNRPGITHVMNYPNPFTTSTRFVFTLTGSEIPEVFTIQILTVTGKVVREITRAELGPLHIGRNITEYAWDGRDQFGDRLANGVYLYKVNTRLNGQKVERNASGADKFFTNEIGKMVLVR